MAIKDTTKKPYIIDRDSNVKIGLDLPIRFSETSEGGFATTKTTMDAVKNNIRNLLSTNQGERLMQPNLGLDLRSLLFEQIDESTLLAIQDSILDSLEYWLPFVEVKDIKILKDDRRSDINKVVVQIFFSIKQDPNTTDSVTVNFSSTINENIDSSTGGY